MKDYVAFPLIAALFDLVLATLSGCGGAVDADLDDGVVGLPGELRVVTDVVPEQCIPWHPGATNCSGEQPQPIHVMPTPAYANEQQPQVMRLQVPAAAEEPVAAPVAKPAPVEPLVSFSVTGIGEYPNAKMAEKKPLETLSMALSEGLARWSAATCVSFEVLPEGGQHRVQFATPEELPGSRVGQVTGQWDAALVQVSTFVPYAAKKKVLVHELGHLLSKNNNHSADGVIAEDLFSDGRNVITESALNQVCATLDCQCFVPETAEPTSAGFRVTAEKSRCPVGIRW